MIQKHSALLEDFLGPLGGCVIYKAYHPQRGDDVAALIELACALPPSVRFIPVSPAVETLHDLRYTLPIILDQLKIHPMPAKKAARSQAQSGWEAEARNILLHLICRVYGHYDDPQVAQEIFDKIPQPILKMLMIMADPQLMPAGRPNASFSPIADQAPILIVGRPEVFAGYGDEDSELRELLEDAGYPNRFEFVGTEPELLRSAYHMRDRKTRNIYTRQERYKDDIGFIFRGQTSQGRIVIVAAGGYSLGTYAAVHTLLNPGPQLERAARKVCSSDERVAVDVGIRCWLKEASDAGAFPLVHERRSLRIAMVNPDDFTRFDWPRQGIRELGPLMRFWGGTAGQHELDSCGPKSRSLFMLWKWDEIERFWTGAKTEKLLRVTVHSRPYCVTDKQMLRPCGVMGDILDQLCEDLEKDREAWLVMMKDWEDASAQTLVGTPNTRRKSVLLAMEVDPARETLAPILLIGPPGSGKEAIARIVARGWNGCGLSLTATEDIRDDMEKGAQRATKGMDGIARLLDSSGTEWLAKASKKTDRLNSFNQVLKRVIGNEIASDLLNSELFGIGPGVATSVRSHVGAFILAGTGVLFLDELLELPPDGQTRFLSALQEAQIRPAGVGKAYVFLARVVAATNRGGNEFGLQRLASQKEIREDLLGRFTRRYSVPPLCERPMETVTALLEMLRTDFRRSAGGPPLFLRISRQAFDALVTCRFSDSFRALKRLRNQLPDDLVAGFRDPYDPKNHGNIDEISITLKHLETLTSVEYAACAGPEPPAQAMMEPQREPETEFYEFSLGSDLQPPVDPGQWWLSPMQRQASDGKLEQIEQILREHQDDLAKLRTFAEEVFNRKGGPLGLKQVFIEIPEVPEQKHYLRDFISSVYEVMMRYDGSLSLKEAHGIVRGVKKTSGNSAVFPLHGMIGRDPTEQSQWRQSAKDDIMECLHKLVPPRSNGERGQPSYFHCDAILALLSGD